MHRWKKRSRAGFTLAEVMLTVAILAILLAVAIPGIIAARDRLEMRRLDDTAREVFLAAQNDLTARKAAGTLGAPGGTPDASAANCYWLSTEDGSTDYLLPAGAVDTGTDSHYMVWYNANSATVLEVYCASKAFMPEVKQGIIDAKYSDSYGVSHKAERRKAKIGYYSGADLTGGAIDQLLPPQLKLVNEDELRAEIVVPNADVYWDTYKVVLTVTVEELDDQGNVVAGHTRTFEKLDYDLFGDALTLVLDSLTGAHFKDVCPEITPGANIRVTATLSAPEMFSAEAKVEGNSLFAARTAGEGGAAVDIACARHLQNLDPNFSNVDWLQTVPTGETAPAVYVTAAVQTADITWPEGLSYQSVNNTKLTAYNGNALTIRELKGANGLFASFTGDTLSNIRIADPVIDGSGNVGALAGELKNTAVKNCRVYAENKKADAAVSGSGNGNMGGLVGRAENCTIENSFAALPKLDGAQDGKIAMGNVGGLIGETDSCEITNCYAVADQLTSGNGSTAMFVGLAEAGTGKKITNCYAVGNLTGGGALAGFANGNSAIFNSYCAVTYDKGGGTKGTPTYGFAPGTVTNCAFMNTGNASLPDATLAKDYTTMTGADWKPGGGDWTALSAVYSNPYRPELSGRDYPFPGLRMGASRIPHYGSWPVETVNQITAFCSESGTDAVNYLVCPTGGSISFWAEPRNNGVPADVLANEPSVPHASVENGLTAMRGEQQGSDSGRTLITVNGVQDGVYAVEISAGSAKLWVPVIVCNPALTLYGSPAEEEVPPIGEVKINSATLKDKQAAYQMLSLRTDTSAKFYATLEIKDLSYQQVFDGLTALYTAANDKNTPVSTGDTPLVIKEEDWMGFRVLQNGKMEQYGPGVSLNEEVSAGVYRLVPDENGDPLYRAATNGSTQGTSETLAVTGQSAGMATVSVCWAIDPTLNVKGNIEVTGTQAFIYSAAAVGSISGDLGAADNYPYLLAIKPLPQEVVTLTLQGKLFGTAPSDMQQEWEWIITDKNGKTVGSGTQELAPGEMPGTIDITIGDKAAHARYKVQMIYKYGTDLTKPVYSTSDFMYIDVARTTKYIDDNPHSSVTVTPGVLDLEQITWGEEGVAAPPGHEGENLKIARVYGNVNQAADTQLLWYLQGDAYNSKTMLTGMDRNEPVVVYGADDMPIARLVWTAGAADNPGGVVTVEALDCNYYGTPDPNNGGKTPPLTFNLLAQARDNGEDSDYKEVPVNILPKLKIDPQSATSVPKNPSKTFTTNRTDGAFGYLWETQWTDTSGGSGQLNSSTANQLTIAGAQGNATTLYTIALTYGPHRAEATMAAKNSNAKGIITTINQDGAMPGSNGEIGYFLLQKDISRPLEFSYSGRGTGNADPYGIYRHPASGEGLSITNPDGTIPMPVNADKDNLSYTYALKGTEYTMEALKLEWHMYGKGNSVLTTPIPYCYVYVVGSELDKKEINLTSLGEEVALELSRHFPTDIGLGAGTFTLAFGNPAIAEISVDGLTEEEMVPGAAPGTLCFKSADGLSDTRTIKLTAKNYGTTTLIATYKIGDYVYTSTCKVTVRDPEHEEKIQTILEPCTGEDLVALNALFGTMEDDEMMVYADYGDAENPKLIPTLLTGRDLDQKNFFGHGVLYLKTYITDGSVDEYGKLNALPLTHYVNDMAISSTSPALIDIYSGHTAVGSGDPYVFYLKVVARQGMGTLSGEDVQIISQFGAMKEKTFDLKVFSEPSVIITAPDGTPITNGHTVVDGFGPNTSVRDYPVKAVLYPWLKEKVVAEDGGVTYRQLDELVWFPEFPSDAYDADSFITLTLDGGGCDCTVSIKASPNCKVAINVQSAAAYKAGLEISKSAHALVFIPKETALTP